jgi:hypothetical protein
MADSWCKPETERNSRPTVVIGEIYFEANSDALRNKETQELSKLVNVMKTYEFGSPPNPANLLFVGDMASSERAGIGLQRALAVKNHLMANVSGAAISKFGSITTQGLSRTPQLGPRGPQSTDDPKVVKIFNNGDELRTFTAPAKTVQEALAKALEVLNQNPGSFGDAAQTRRIRHWLEGTGKASVERGDDGYLSAEDYGSDLSVTQGKRRDLLDALKVSEDRFRSLISRIGPRLMAQANKDKDTVITTLKGIDEGIKAGLEYMSNLRKFESQRTMTSGAAPIQAYVMKRGNDASSFYYVYVPKVGPDATFWRDSMPESGYALNSVEDFAGTWTVTVDDRPGDRKWVFKYELKKDRTATWEDTRVKGAGHNGTGSWTLSGRRLEFKWNNSSNKEVWEPAGSSKGQKGKWVVDGTERDLSADKN